MPPESIDESAPDQVHLRRAWAELEHMDSSYRNSVWVTVTG
jgi:hypothetical protein